MGQADWSGAVTFVLAKSGGQVLMQLRDDGRGRKIRYPNMWTFPGGNRQGSETPMEVSIREIKEEYNLDVMPQQGELIAVYNHDDDINDQVFLFRLNQDAKPELREGKGMEWLTIDKIKKNPAGLAAG